MSSQSSLPWHSIPSSPSKTTCNVSLLQAGGLTIPTDMVILPGPNKPNASIEPGYDKSKGPKFYVPDYVFLIEHTPTRNHYLFDLGMRRDLENLPPPFVKNMLPTFDCYPEAPEDLLKDHGSPEQQPEKVKAVIFSHGHFDHIGAGSKSGFSNAEFWLGPTCCTYTRPGYPIKEDSAVPSDAFPTDGSRKIIEAHVSDELLEQTHDERVGKVAQAQKAGLYEAVELRDPEKGWAGLGAFDRAFDVFGDGSAYLVDAPGHVAGHQMMLIRVKSNPDGNSTAGSGDDFVLLAGDCYHHPAMLKEPLRTARPPYSQSSMHSDPEQAIDSIARTREFNLKDNVWVVGAHDFEVGEAIVPGRKEIKGLVLLNDWREKNWKKKQLHAADQ